MDEKWIEYNPSKKGKSWVKKGKKGRKNIKKPQHGKKSMLSVFWDSKGVIFWEIIPQGQRINAGYFCQQLHKIWA